MFVGVRVVCVWVAVVCVRAAVGPRRSNSDGRGGGVVNDGGREGIATCGAALLQELHTITELVLGINNQIKAASQLPPPPPPPLVVHDCSTLRQAGFKGSGVYQVFPFTFKVFCDMMKHGGGWTVIQRRLAQKVQENFTQGWSSYREGFGRLDGEMWLGLEALHQLTHSGQYELRVDMVDYELGRKYAHYQIFRVGPEEDGYRLFVANYSGNAGDSLTTYHSGRRFSTFDRDQDVARDKNCAQDKEGGWWFHACYSAHPNGRFPATLSRTDSADIRWWKSREQVLVLTNIEMKIRRRGTSDEAHQNDPLDEDDHTASHEEDKDDSFDEYPSYKNDTGGEGPTHEHFTDLEARSDTPPWAQRVVPVE